MPVDPSRPSRPAPRRRRWTLARRWAASWCLANSGFARISSHRPAVPIVVVTSLDHVARHTNTAYGQYAFKIPEPADPETRPTDRACAPSRWSTTQPSRRKGCDHRRGRRRDQHCQLHPILPHPTRPHLQEEVAQHAVPGSEFAQFAVQKDHKTVPSAPRLFPSRRSSRPRRPSARPRSCAPWAPRAGTRNPSVSSWTPV